MSDIVGQPALLVGLIATIGLILQRKPFAAVLAGGVKTAVGYLIIVGGAGMVVGVLANTLSPLIQAAFGLTAPAAEMGGMGYPKFLQLWGGYATVAVALGFAVNLLLARFTKFKYIYLTGHLMIFLAENIFMAVLVGWPTISPALLTDHRCHLRRVLDLAARLHDEADEWRNRHGGPGVRAYLLV